ncbi:unnamed protein product, partial [Iphiclides podalirius]
MNGLTLRISGSNSKKIKGSLSFNPVIISDNLIAKTDAENLLHKNFHAINNVDEQLTILKEYLNECDELPQSLLVKAFLNAEVKHPVKCFIARYITKNSHLQEPFAKVLSKEILSHVLGNNNDDKGYLDFVPKIASCIENFPAGAMAVKEIDLKLSEYLTKCLQNCIDTLRSLKSLSPTGKNEIYDLAHLSLRLLLHIVQKVHCENVASMMPLFNTIKHNVKALLFEEDVPMDTKSVSGILLVSMHIIENGSNSWIEREIFEILKSNKENRGFGDLIENDSAKLSLYSALVTVVAAEELFSENVNNDSALIVLTNNIIDIGESTITSSTFTLGVTRTLVQTSRALPKAPDSILGGKLVDRLLTFVWSHLEHHMDSVRHLTAQILANIVKYCTALKKGGDDKALDGLFTALSRLDQCRKSYYVSLTSLTLELGARCILQRFPDVVRDVIAALDIQAVQASATTTLETLLQKHSKESTSEITYDVWVKPILERVTTQTLDSAVLNILEGLLLRAVKLDEDLMSFLLPYIKELPSADLKCVLMLLSVARKSESGARAGRSEDQWRGLVPYEVLEMAASDAADEVRSLSLSLVVESRRTTEAFSPRELGLVRRHLALSANAQQPDARQQTLALIKKFVRRLEDSYKVLRRQKLESGYYLAFVDDLRGMCYGFLIPGVNYGRRHVSLQVLVWCENATFEGYRRTWKPEYVLRLMMHLEDSYESNKSFALEILNLCPVELIESQKCSVGLELGEIFRLASSLKPTDCVSAAYKMKLMRNRLPEDILQGRSIDSPEGVSFALLSDLMALVREQLSVCRRSVVLGARGASMYGALHCALPRAGHARRPDARWSTLVEEVVGTCAEVNAAVACVVNNSSPEGHLPMDSTGVLIYDHGNSANVTLEDGRPVTAQMVLLCAWRSVKEVSLVLGSISSRLSIRGEGQEHGTLSVRQMVLMGEHFTRLLAETKHRGAFEQAYVGFTKLLSRLWRCRRAELHGLPLVWLRALLRQVGGGAGAGGGGEGAVTSRLCPTRRSAGLPFMIQALVATELQVSEQPRCLQECVATLLRLCSEGAPPARVHCSNVLRALVRCAPLQQHVAPYIGDALVLALKGFDGTTWEERNASTLLLSALTARAVGGSRVGGNRAGGVRGGGGGEGSARGRITGRLFFLRYPRLYDFMLEKLNEASQSGEARMKPSLYPILLLLGRLYPSALEGTVSNLKLSGLAKPVAACANAPSLYTRRLAARALAPLVSPHAYIPHIEESLKLIADNRIRRNFCHGLLLQVTTLLENKPDNLVLGEETTVRIKVLINQTMWILEHFASDLPCYLIIDEYTKMINLLIWRFPSLIDRLTVQRIIDNLEMILTPHRKETSLNCGMEVCLANATSLHFIILNKYCGIDDIERLVYKTLYHHNYEVVLATLDYLLVLYEELDIDNKLQEHLDSIARDKKALEYFRKDPNYTRTLYNVLKGAKYLECRYKCLKLLSLEDNTQEYVIRANLIVNTEMSAKMGDEVILTELTRLIESEHENLTHIYLYSLSSFLTKRLMDSNICGRYVLETVRLVFACSSPDNSDKTRSVVVGFLEKNFKTLIELELCDLSEEERFEVRATLWATLVTVLEDDEHILRGRCSRVVTQLVGCGPAVGSRAAQLLRRHVASGRHGLPLLCALALLDFRCQVCLADDADDECRVFDQNEKYNVFLEETVWTVACAEEIKSLCAGEDLCGLVLAQLEEPTFKQTFDRLCGRNVAEFKDLLEGSGNAVTSKVDLFARHLSGQRSSSDFNL